MYLYSDQVMVGDGERGCGKTWAYERASWGIIFILLWLSNQMNVLLIKVNSSFLNKKLLKLVSR